MRSSKTLSETPGTKKRVIICTTDFQHGTYVVSHQGSEPFEVPFRNSSSKRMTRHDWEEVFPGIAPPDDLSEQGKLVFGGGAYYSYFGSYFDVLNETSCSFGGWTEASTEIDEVESEPGSRAVQTYDDLISFLDSRGVYYGGADTESGGKSVTISVEQEWADGMIPDNDPRSSVVSVTYYFNENDGLGGVELNIWAPRLLDFVNEDVPDASLILSIGDLEYHPISAICIGSNNCSTFGLPEGLVGGYWSQKVNELVERYLNIEGLY
ncbi:MAG: hypothetical protein HYY44_04745 [Deltaproteobacteria bacterium]|nr:hypothetical protein [Deltaproteobacteria bacterium]